MTIATLGLEISSAPIAKAAIDLDKLPAAASRAETAATKLQGTFDKTGASASSMADRIQLAAGMGGKSTQGYAEAVTQAYGATGKYSTSQIDTIRNYETQIGRSQLLSQGLNREAAQFMALRKAGTTGNTQYGQTVAQLSGALYDLDQHQKKTDNSGIKLADTLTRRFVLGFLVSQIRTVVSSVIDLNSELAKVGDLGRLTGAGSSLTQGLTSAAGYKGVAGADFTSGMIAFNQQIPLAKAGIGSLGELLRGNKVAVTDTVDAFFKVADLVKNARNETERESIVRQAGLPATMQMVDYLKQGADVIRRQAADAPKISDGYIDASKKIEDRFNKLWTDFKTNGKVAVVDVADGWVDAWNRPFMDPSTLMGGWWNKLKAKYGNTKEREEAANASSSAPLPWATPLGQGGVGSDARIPLRVSSPTIDVAVEKAIAQKQISDAQPFVGLFGAPPTAAEIAKRERDDVPALIAANNNEPVRSENDRGHYRRAA
jgi:hypothetical protein